MKKQLLLLLLIVFITQAKAQTCGTGGCAAADTNATGKYPASTFSTTFSTWSTVSAYMNAGNYTLFNVTSGDTYEWTYCSDFGGSQAWDAELTLFNNATGATLCYQNNCGRSTCSTAPYIRWTASFTGIVKLLTTVSGCGTNTGSPYSKLVWRDTSGTVPVQIIGVDVYSGNGTINWAQVKAAGYTFAYAKATEGVGYTDSKYLSYAVNGVAAGMKMGAYHFARPDLNPTNAGAIAEANYFLSVAQPYIVSCQLPPSLDLEGSYLTTSFTSAQLTAWVQNWMTTVETATGIKPVLYIGASTVSFLNSSLNTYPLWRDELTGSPSPATNLGVWTTWAFNQYSWTGTVPGIAGSQTDLDFFNGNTMAAFNTFMGCSVATDLQQNTMNAALVIYPNPTTGLFTIETNSTDLLAMDLYDVNGRLVFSKAISDKSNIDVTMLDEGFYTMTLKSVDRVITKKLVIVR
jgi:GH25 family lysozyme M1 (1,4-beta-N-acetylmuramidase)